MQDNIGSNNPQDCLVCKNRESKNIYSGILRKCLTCGFVTATCEVNKSAIKELYSENYFKGDEYMDYEADKLIIQKNFRKKTRKMLKAAGRRNIKSILDIGCAYGFFGEVVKEIMPDTAYFGLDISEKAIHYASEELNLSATCGNYLDYEVEEKYSDVCMWDVIEHLQFPDRVIEKIHSDLLPGGRVWITTGNIKALIPRVMRGKWRMIHPPTHLHYFSARTLSLLLEKIGFNVKRISYPFVSRGCKQIFYSTFMLGREPGKFIRDVYSAIPERMSLSMNTFDIMFLQAVKK